MERTDEGLVYFQDSIDLNEWDIFPEYFAPILW